VVVDEEGVYVLL